MYYVTKKKVIRMFADVRSLKSDFAIIFYFTVRDGQWTIYLMTFSWCIIFIGLQGKMLAQT